MFSAEQMYRLVNDVAAYPQFLPGCVGSAVLAEEPERMQARVDVAKAGIRQSFTTENRLIANQEIRMQLVSGPFRQLQGAWRFLALDEQACKVELSLEFEFSSKLIEVAFGRIFTDLMGAMVQAFTQRAKEIYGD